jgi:outer membrane protein W|tara:strand:+ start:17798 stop:18811 length:1014 start_codon:yes stop_codon:yes gene_type:complete
MTGIITRTMATTMTKMSIALMLALSTSSVYAAQDNAYHHEAELSFLDSDDGGDGLFNANYRYYFKAVEQADKPYALSGFFHQGSTVAARYSTSSLDNLYQLSGQYVFDSKWFIGAEVRQVNFEEDNYSISLESFTTYSANLGYFFTDHSALTLNYSRMSESESSSFASTSYNYEAYNSRVNDVFSLTYEHFIPLQSTAGVMLTGAFSYSDQKITSNDLSSSVDNLGQVTIRDSKIYMGYSIYNLAINADWYINNAWSVGANVEQRYLDTNYNFSGTGFDNLVHNYDQTDTYTGINTRYVWRFADVFSAKFALDHSYFNGEFDNDSQTSFSVGINARF